MREATLTASPKTSLSSSTTGPKWKPTWIAMPPPPPVIAAPETCSCMSSAAAAASSAAANRHITSSPMVLISAPPCFSVDSVISSTQRPIMRRALASPCVSYSRVLPETSANSIAIEDCCCSGAGARVTVSASPIRRNYASTRRGD